VKGQPSALLVLAMFTLLSPSAMLAEGASVGSITGVVRDESGAVLPGD
jgi:hypothetical protein